MVYDFAWLTDGTVSICLWEGKSFSGFRWMFGKCGICFPLSCDWFRADLRPEYFRGRHFWLERFWFAYFANSKLYWNCWKFFQKICCLLVWQILNNTPQQWRKKKHNFHLNKIVCLTSVKLPSIWALLLLSLWNRNPAIVCVWPLSLPLKHCALRPLKGAPNRPLQPPTIGKENSSEAHYSRHVMAHEKGGGFDGNCFSSLLPPQKKVKRSWEKKALKAHVADCEKCES